jgi:hypothetical protein
MLQSGKIVDARETLHTIETTQFCLGFTSDAGHGFMQLRQRPAPDTVL